MRLSVEETLRNLKQVEEKYKIRFTPTGEVNISEMARDCIDTIEALQQENEQLRAQVARMRELLAKAYDEIETYKCLWKSSKPGGCDCPKPTALQDEIEQALTAIDKVIGGKEDV